MSPSGAGKRPKRSKSRGTEFEQNVVGIVVVRADGTIGYINSYLANLIGDLPADLVNQPILDFVAEQDRTAIAEVVKDCVSGKRRFVQLESTITHKSGKIVDIFIDASAAVFEGQPAAIGAVLDISARNQVEAELRASEAKHANALKIVDASEWEYDVLADRFTFNDDYYRIFRTTAEAVGGYTMSSADYTRRFVHPDDREIVGAEVKAAIETNDPNFSRRLEHRILYADGTTGYIAVRIFIVKDEAGRTIKTYGVNLDITKYKQAEQALVVSELKLQMALTNMSQGLLMHDAEGRVILTNSRFAEIFGLPQDKNLLGMTIPELFALMDSTSGVRFVEPEATLERIEKSFHATEEENDTHLLNDGRSIAAARRPMPNGGVVVTFDDITQRLADQAEIRHMAQFDALTELPNRVSFYNQMDTVLKHLRRNESLGVLSLDLDHFKEVNDTFGHPIGDRLLKEAARRMQSCLRGGDIAARLGGDEFAILQVPAEKPSDITALASRLIEVVAAPYDFDGNQVIVEVSVGVAVAPNDGEEPDILMKNADLALYRAKADGRGVCRFFEPEMDARMQARRIIEFDLRKAIHNGGEFELLYQPMVDVKTGKVTSCEALLRWNSPERGIVMPDDFIPAAEATGLIVPLGEWVLREACVDASRWPKEITVTVNLSPGQFKSKKLVQSVENALAESGLPASRLVLEITEQVLMNESEGAFVILHKIRDLGIRISMDDFGIGYSSIGHLRTFPFSTIKIDQSFIHDLPGKQDSLAIVRAVIGLSRSLGFETIAEGVETEEQLANVTSEGCNLFQGFFFSEPRPSIEVEEFFKAQG